MVVSAGVSQAAGDRGVRGVTSHTGVQVLRYAGDRLGRRLVALHSMTHQPAKIISIFKSLNFEIWRREWDSNPRWTCAHAGFQDRCLKPLGHPSNSLSYLAFLPAPSQRTGTATQWDCCRLLPPGEWPRQLAWRPRGVSARQNRESESGAGTCRKQCAGVRVSVRPRPASTSGDPRADCARKERVVLDEVRAAEQIAVAHARPCLRRRRYAQSGGRFRSYVGERPMRRIPDRPQARSAARRGCRCRRSPRTRSRLTSPGDIGSAAWSNGWPVLRRSTPARSSRGPRAPVVSRTANRKSSCSGPPSSCFFCQIGQRICGRVWFGHRIWFKCAINMGRGCLTGVHRAKSSARLAGLANMRAEKSFLANGLVVTTRVQMSTASRRAGCQGARRRSVMQISARLLPSP